jgi:hypothetical protein
MSLQKKETRRGVIVSERQGNLRLCRQMRDADAGDDAHLAPVPPGYRANTASVTVSPADDDDGRHASVPKAMAMTLL